jgi:LuxR family maltose regulon positive regulatory protein
MLADADGALAGLSPTGKWYPSSLLVRGFAALMLGDPDEADALLAEAATAAAAAGRTDVRMVALGQLSLLARERGDPGRAETLAAEARSIVARAGLESYAPAALGLAAAAHTALRHGRSAEAGELVVAAVALTPRLTEALPWLAVATRLELAHCSLRLGDTGAARLLGAEIDAVLDVRPSLGVYAERARELRETLGTPASASPTASSGLTPAELRLLPLLATHLSFREIGERLDVSGNTVKTQAISIYRKLGVGGRSEAIATATQAGAST